MRPGRATRHKSAVGRKRGAVENHPPNLRGVLIEGDDIYGDGVNLAARLQPLAEPGGICVSSIVNESIGNRIDVRFLDAGQISVKNIDRPIRIWT